MPYRAARQRRYVPLDGCAVPLPPHRRRPTTRLTAPLSVPRAEFVAKVGVALEEADESAFWLEIIIDIRMVAGNLANKLLDEANQLTAILAASSITASEGHK